MSKPVKITYVGGIDEVSVLFPSGDQRNVKRGESIDVLASDAAALNPGDWTGLPAPKPTDETE
jgi:hypothetical protein